MLLLCKKPRFTYFLVKSRHIGILICHCDGIRSEVSIWPKITCVKEARREGEKGKVFPGPATFGGPHHRSKILKRVFQMASF